MTASKRRFVLAAVAALLCGWSRAAAGQRGGVTLGANLGYSRSDVAGADARQVESRTATLAGAFVRIPFADWISLQPEVLFSRKGGTTTATLPAQSTPSSLDFEFVYLEIPFLLRLRTPAIGHAIRPMAFGGAAAGFDIGCDINITQSAARVRGSCQDAGLHTTSVDFSAVAGGGFEIQLGNSFLGIEARYSASLRPVFENNLDLKNRQFGLLLEVPF